MDKYRDYLAVNVLNEERIVSYRTLSRALKVHSNLAKQMLYDFHHKQNAKKPRSVHATYIISGKRKAEPKATNGTQTQDTEDTVMDSSPFPSSMPEPESMHDDSEEEDVYTTSLILVKEEDLDKAKAMFHVVESVHIYSLQLGTPQDLQILSECNREVSSKYASEDPLDAWKQYGIIQNPHVKRRTRKGPPPAAPIATTAAAKMAPRPSTAALAKEEKNGASGKKGTTPQVDAAAIPPKHKDAKAAAPTLRRDKSDIFKAFAKTKPKKAGSAGSSAAQSPAADAPSPDAMEDEAMKEPSEDEEEADLLPTNTKSNEEARKARADREAHLRKMMEDDEDEVMADAPTVEEAVDEGSPLDKQPEQKEQKREATVTVSGGRRRGRRRVMKKKTVRDEEGFLVTKEEPAWESFSEDEPEPKKVKMPVMTGGAAKGKKSGAKQGQGNIMSFFGKK